MNREQTLLEKIKSLTNWDDAELEKKIGSQSGNTRTRKIIGLLESLNTVEETVSVSGIFTGSFSKGKPERLTWRIAAEDGESVLLDVEDNKAKAKEPEFGQHLEINKVKKTLHQISERTDYTAQKSSAIKISEGDVMSITQDIGAVDEGWSLVSGALYKHAISKDKAMITDKLNLRVTIQSNEQYPREDGTNGFRFVTGFLNRVDQLVALFPTSEHKYIQKLLEKEDYGGVEEALATIEWNPNLRMSGVNLILYGALENKTWTGNDGSTKDGWQIGIAQIYNLDNLSFDDEGESAEPEESVPEEEPEQEEPVVEEEEAVEESEPEEETEAEAEEPNPIEASMEEEVKKQVCKMIEEDPEATSMTIVTRLMKELDLDKQYVTKIMGQMVSKKQIKAKPNGRLEIVKGD